MARKKKDEEQLSAAEDQLGPGRRYRDRPILKETIALGIAGEIERPPIDMPPSAEIQFTARGIVDSFKYKVSGVGWQEILTIKIDRDTFEVLSVKEVELDPQLPHEYAPPAGNPGGLCWCGQGPNVEVHREGGAKAEDAEAGFEGLDNQLEGDEG